MSEYNYDAQAQEAYNNQTPVEIKAEKTINNPKSYKKTGLELIDSIVPVIHNHCRSSHKQITAITIIDIAYIAAYSGLKGTAHYLFDFSSSGSGKDSSANHSKDLILSPVVAIQMEDAKYYANERKEDKDLPPKQFKCVHGGDTTVQAVYKGFEVVRSQYIRRGEIGTLLRDKSNPTMNFITDSYGRKTIETPSYKKELDLNIPLEVDDASLFFYGNSNLSMLSIDIFKYHMKGGLINRCILLYEDYIREFEDLPEIYDLPQNKIDEANQTVSNFIKWGNSHKHINKPILNRTAEYIKFSKWVYDKENDLRGGDSQDIYKRTMENLNAVIYTFHYLSCFEEDKWRDMPTVKITSNAIKYMKWIISPYDNLMNEVSGVNEEIRGDEKSIKILAYIREQKLPITLRDVYRKMNLKRVDIERAILGIYKCDGKTITSRVMT